MLSVTHARLPHYPPFHIRLTCLVTITRLLLRPLTTRAFHHTTSRHPIPPSTAHVFWRTTSHIPLLRMSLSEPLLNPLTPMPLPHFCCGCQRVNTCVVAIASLFGTTNHDGPLPQLPHLSHFQITLIYQYPRGRTRLWYSRYFYSKIRHRSRDFRVGHTTS